MERITVAFSVVVKWWLRVIRQLLASRRVRRLALGASGVCIAGAAGLRVARWVYIRFKDWRIRLASKIVEWTGRRHASELRRAFLKEFAVVMGRAEEMHSHGNSAMVRTRAALAIREFVVSHGYEPYVISTSNRDADQEGYHQFYQVRDLVHPPRRDEVRGNSVLVAVDVDYYMDMSTWLQYGRPLLAYTFVPDSVAGVDGDANYTIVDDELVMSVNGGAGYRHRLWDYTNDSFFCQHFWWGCMAYTVETRQLTETRRVVLLEPVFSLWFPFSWLLWDCGLKRLSFAAGGSVNRLDFTKPGSPRLYTSVGMAGKFVSVTMPLSFFEAAATRFRSVTKPDIHTLTRFIRAEETATNQAFGVTPEVGAAVLFECLSNMCGTGAVVLAGAQNHPDNYVSHYRGGRFELTDEPKRLLGRVVGPVLVTNPAVVPADCWNNDLAAVQGRIVAVRNHVRLTAFVGSTLAEFARFLVPDEVAGSLYPWSTAEVEEVQTKPTQRVRSERVRMWIHIYDACVVKAFVKKESYGKVTAPRNISTVPAEETLAFSGFTYAFKKAILVDQPWYVPTMTPPEIASRLQDVASKFGVLKQTDYSKFDGTQTADTGKLLKTLYLRAFHPQYRHELSTWMDQEMTAKAFTKYGHQYWPGGTKLSGSPLTTDGNTILNAYVNYLAARLSGRTAKEAWQLLQDGVMAAGDDGVTPVDTEAMEKACGMMGFKIKLESKRAGEAVSFLGRLFVDPWTVPWSVQDPMRTWTKLHISFAPSSISDKQAIVERCQAYLLLDPFTPVTSDYCRRLLKEHGAAEPTGLCVFATPDVPFYARLIGTWGWAGWPAGPDWRSSGHRDHPTLRAIAESIGVESATVIEWADRIRDCRDLREIERLIDNGPRSIEVGCAIYPGGPDGADPQPDERGSTVPGDAVSDTVLDDRAARAAMRGSRVGGVDQPIDGPGGGTDHQPRGGARGRGRGRAAGRHWNAPRGGGSSGPRPAPNGAWRGAAWSRGGGRGRGRGGAP